MHPLFRQGDFPANGIINRANPIVFMKVNVTSLKKELENSFGRRIKSSRDCIQMVDDIYHKTGETINSNTLRRFFGLVKADYPASTSTLNILSRYCGFNSIDEIEQISNSDNGETVIHKEEIVKYMVSLFRSSRSEERRVGKECSAR